MHGICLSHHSVAQNEIPWIVDDDNGNKVVRAHIPRIQIETFERLIYVCGGEKAQRVAPFSIWINYAHANNYNFLIGKRCFNYSLPTDETIHVNGSVRRRMHCVVDEGSKKKFNFRLQCEPFWQVESMFCRDLHSSHRLIPSRPPSGNA